MLRNTIRFIHDQLLIQTAKDLSNRKNKIQAYINRILQEIDSWPCWKKTPKHLAPRNCFDWIQSPLIILSTCFCQSMKLFPLRKDQTEKRCPFWQPTRLTQPWRTSNQRASAWLTRRPSGLQPSFYQWTLVSSCWRVRCAIRSDISGCWQSSVVFWLKSAPRESWRSCQSWGSLTVYLTYEFLPLSFIHLVFMHQTVFETSAPGVLKFCRTSLWSSYWQKM